MIPTALLFSRYRAFRDSTRLELAPLTIIIGRNGDGKSVLTRLPLLLSSGLQPEAEAPVDLGAGGISHAARFEDLIYQRSAQPFSLGAEIAGGGKTCRFITTLRHIVEKKALGIEAFELFVDNQPVIGLKVARPEDIGNPEGTFIAQFGPESNQAEVRAVVAGLFPLSIDGHEAETATVREWRAAFAKALSMPSYLGPFRLEQGSPPRIPRQGVRDLGPRGERALDMSSGFL